ncbi:YdeI/OmpD-associated family protein [Leptospira yasudae]|uniref:Bacteriocin-protection protein n=1 Tax=Leptospira yasudae TaxID=2202201 RepID=A0ABX9M7Y9_9LEPT|nr:YdeI/OmpD-associated family protein [Leptospira yasudae]RHX82126.1 bacteriocin-protection protein [Leptospira yasudae]
MIELNPDVIKKMKLKEGNRLFVASNETRTNSPSIGGIELTNRASEANGILLFAGSASSLKSAFKKIVTSLREDTLLWIAYPKKSSGIKTDLDRDHGWEPITEIGYDGIALISLNDTWSAVRFKKSDTVKKGGSKAEKQKRPELSKYIDYAKKTVKLPEDVTKSFYKNKDAKQTFESLSWSHKREFIESILEAKNAETRTNRILKMIEKLGAKKSGPTKRKTAAKSPRKKI